jgi:hypothetical protein
MASVHVVLPARYHTLDERPAGRTVVCSIGRSTIKVIVVGVVVSALGGLLTLPLLPNNLWSGAKKQKTGSAAQGQVCFLRACLFKC